MYSTIVDTKNKVSQIPEGGLEISKLNSTYPCQVMKGFVEKQLSRFQKSFKFDEDACSGSNEGEVILLESDQNDKEKIRESNKTSEQSSCKESNRVNCKSNSKEKKT